MGEKIDENEIEQRPKKKEENITEKARKHQ